MTTFKHHATYWLPGSFFAEDYSRTLPERTVEAALANAPEHAFAFELYDTAIVDFEFDASLYRVLPIALNKGSKHFIGGTVFTCDELRALAVEEGEENKYDTLIANISTWTKDGGYVDGRAIRCPAGNWQPYEGEPVHEVPTHA